MRSDASSRTLFIVAACLVVGLVALVSYSVGSSRGFRAGEARATRRVTPSGASEQASPSGPTTPVAVPAQPSGTSSRPLTPELGAGGWAPSRTAAEAVEALHSLGAAVEVGLNMEEYARRDIDAKVVVDRFLRGPEAARVPNLRAEVQAAMDDYQYANHVWGRSLSRSGRLLRVGSLYGREAIQRYPGVRPSSSAPESSDIIWYTDVLRAAWSSAEEHLFRADAALRAGRG